MDSTLRSASQSSVTAIGQNDSSSSPQADNLKADTDLSFYSTRNEGEIRESTTFIPTLTPSPPFPSTLFSEVSSEQTYGAQINVDEDKVQLAYPPSDGTEASQLPPLVPVRRHSQSQLNGQTQSATTSSPIAQNTSTKVSPVPTSTPANTAAPQGHQHPSQYSQESYRVPIAQPPQTQIPRTSGNIPAVSPRTSGENWNSERSSSRTPQQYTTPLQQSASTTPMYSGIPSQAYGPSQRVETPPRHASGPTQPSIPQSVPLQSYIIPNVPTPHASRSYHLPSAPTPQGHSMYETFITQTSGSPYGQVPSRQPLQASPYPHPIGQTTTPQTFRKGDAFVASDPFRVTHRKENVDAPSDGLTFDDIPTAGRPPGPVLTRPYRSYSLPSMPTQSRYPGTTPQSHSLPMRPVPLAQAPSIFEGTSEQFHRRPTSSQYYSTSNAHKPPSQPIYTGTHQESFPQPTSSQFYNIPNAPTPQAQPIYTGTPPQSYSLPNSFPNRPTPQAESIHSGTPPQSYSLPNRPTPHASQPIYTGTSYPFIPQQFIPQPAPPQFYNNVSPPPAQPIHTGIHQPSQMPGSFAGASYVRPSPSYFTGYNPTPQVIKPSFVANDPFQVSYGGAVVDAPSNFDDISTARSSPEPVMAPYGGQPTFGEYYYPGNERPPIGAYGQVSTQPGAYPSHMFNDERPWYQPAKAEAPSIIVLNDKNDRRNSRHRHHRREHRRPRSRSVTPPTPQEYTGLAHHLPSIPHIQPKSPTVLSPPVQSEAQERRGDEEEGQKDEEDVPSIHHSPVIAPNTDDIAIHHSPNIVPNTDDIDIPPAVPSIPSIRSSSPYRSQDVPFTHGPYMGSYQTPFGSYVFDRPYLPYSPYPPYPQYQYARRPKKSFFSRLFGSSDLPVNPQPFTAIYPQPFTEPYTAIYPSMDPEVDWHEAVVDFFLVAFPKQMYLLLLLRLPSLYFSRVARIFEEADLTLPEIKKMALETASQGLTHEYEIEMAFESSSVPPVYKRLTSTWEFFIDSVMREWKTFNIISVLLLTAILTILQLPSAADDPVTRYTALFSLMCALISLLFGCMYIIRFGTMRKSYKAAEWALEAKKSKTLIWWNVWILLAMPAIWLTWSIILYIACIMSFIWRTGVTSTTPPGLSDTGLLVIRIVMSVVLGIGVLYGLLIMTTFRRYGMVMDNAWKQRIKEWTAEKAGGNIDSYTYPDTPHWYPGRSGRYHRPSPSGYYQRYPRDTTYTRMSRSTTPSSKSYPSPPYAQPIIVPLPPGSPHSTPSTKSDDQSTINRPGPNQPAPQPDSRPTRKPKGPVTPAEGLPPRIIPERTLYPIIEASVTSPSEDGNNALGFSSGLENRNSGGGGGGGDETPDDGNHVRFRLPSGSSDISDDWQGIIASRKTHSRKTPKR